MNDKLDQGNRTFIGSVCFVDIVGYSKKSVSEQIMMKDRFTSLLSEALKDVAIDQRIILDTGDGAAISFLGDPEDALFVTMHMRDFLQRALIDADEATIANELGLRIGINLGPVKLIRDINGQPNIVGDGINVAQRIMSFAQPSQVVVSRSYYDVVSVISEEYAKLFHYEGSRTDKHVREHEIYIVGESVAAFNQAKAGMVDRAAVTNTNTKIRAAQVGGAAGTSTGAYGFSQAEGGAPSGLAMFLQDRKKLMMAGGALAVIASLLIAALMMKKPNSALTPAVDANAKMIEKPFDAAAQTPASANAKPDTAKADNPPGVSATDPTKTVEGTLTNPATSAAEPAATALPIAGAASANPSAQPNTSNNKNPTLAAKPTDGAKAARDDSTKTDAPKLVSGTVAFSIQPWGEVFVNGKSIGVSPPLKQTKLPPGKYKIEIKNSTFTPLTTSIEVKSKEETPIKHKFQ